jgi:O-antigen/teichoic acid export membrane protein
MGALCMKERGTRMTQQWNMKAFMKGAALLTLSALVVKLLGAVYRVPFQNLVGDKGFYIYQQVYPFVAIFTVWTSYGFAVAISKLLAGTTDSGERNSIMRIAFFYLAVLSVGFFVVLMVFAPLFSTMMGDSGLVPLIRVSAYVALTMPLLALFKGTFQSEGQMVPVAVSQVIEQAVRVFVILVVTWIAVRVGASLYITGEVAMWGAVAGECFGVVVLALYFKKKLTSNPMIKGRTVPIWSVVKELTALSLSVSMSSLILLMFQLADSFTIYSSLVEGGTGIEAAMVMKGVYDRGQPLVQMGILIASTLALAIVPLIAHHARKEHGRGATPYVSLTFRTAFLFGWAAALGLALVLPFVNEMLFETRDGSAALIVFTIQIFYLSLILPLTAMLQGIGKVRVPALLLLSGLVIKWVGNSIFVPLYGVMGASISGNIGFIFITTGLFLYFKRVWPVQFAPLRFYKWIAVASLAMVVSIVAWSLLADGVLFYKYSSRLGATVTALTSIAIGASVFLTIIAKSRIMSEKEWFLLPFGRRMAKIQLFLTQSTKRNR